MSLKLNLSINPLEFINGYKNISPFAPVDDSRFARNSVINLDMVADDAELDEIRAMNVLEYYPPQAFHEILNEWVKKLAHKGKLTIGGTDIYFIARQINTRNINPDQALVQLYGDSDKPGKQKKSIYSILYIVDQLQKRGLKILMKKLMDDGTFVITGERN